MADMDCDACRVPIYRFVRTLNRKKYIRALSGEGSILTKRWK